MKEITFKGTFSAVNQQAAEWEAAHPKYKVIERSPPTGEAHHAVPGQDVFDSPTWHITIHYKE